MPDRSTEFDLDASDPQDRAEAEDETHINEDADEFATLEEAPDTYDVSVREGDEGDERALSADAAELDVDALDEESVEDDELGDRPDEYQPEVEWAEATGEDELEAESAVEDALEPDEIEGLDEVADADSVEGGEDDFTNFQSKTLSDADLEALGYARSEPLRRKR
ncbi:MAG TPA: hypothetical protein VN805_03255 [Caulobacteraceae bacterium]|nr:hypothetical protein [Caulobacteraceae bacterium]